MTPVGASANGKAHRRDAATRELVENSMATPSVRDPDRERVLLSYLIGRADYSRDAAEYRQAAVLYGEARLLAPERTDLLVQQGHMFKEAGDLVSAERCYDVAGALMPRDADLALQRGHFYKTAGRLADAVAWYREAAALHPKWNEPRNALAGISRAGWRGLGDDATIIDPRGSEDGSLSAHQIARLVPALAPRPPADLVIYPGERLSVSRFGRPEPGFWGNARTVRGVEAVRGVCMSSVPVLSVQIKLNDLTICEATVSGGYPIAHAEDPDHVLKYVFNVWFDFGAFRPGRYRAEIWCRDIEDRVQSFQDHIVIAEPLSASDAAVSDAFVPLAEPDIGRLDRAIRDLPSVVRPAERALFPHGVGNVLLMRTDQLGDIISSAPAIRRLRQILPTSHIVGMLTAANADIARTLDLFDEIIVVDFPDDREERRRLMPLAEQEVLRRRLEQFAFDVAIDLSQSDVSRPLLRLSGAKFLYGVGGGDWPWLTAEFGLNTHDPLNRLDVVPHSAKTLALIEAFGALVADSFVVVRRDDLTRDIILPFNIAHSDRYVILHAGARIEFSRWPHFAALAHLVLASTSHIVVLMTDDPAIRERLPGALVDHPRFRLIDRRLSFDEFDALVSFSDVLVGNDSGPKHLAALRGVHTVTLFTARINWREWGQEKIGTIISRRVPCAGCALFHDAEECGKDFTCIRDIRPEEVFGAMNIPSVHSERAP